MNYTHFTEKKLLVKTLERGLILLVLLALITSCKSNKTTSNTKRYTPPVKKVVTNNTSTTTKTSTVKKNTTNVVAKKTANLNTVIATAKTYLGTPHVMGGMTKKGIDCSGLMVQSFKAIDVTIPRVSRAQAEAGVGVPLDKLQKGDLVFFTYPGGTRITHVGMVSKVLNKDQVTFIHTSSSRGVREDQLFGNYWKKLIVKARRLY